MSSRAQLVTTNGPSEYVHTTSPTSDWDSRHYAQRSLVYRGTTRPWLWLVALSVALAVALDAVPDSFAHSHLAQHIQPWAFSCVFCLFGPLSHVCHCPAPGGRQFCVTRVTVSLNTINNTVGGTSCRCHGLYSASYVCLTGKVRVLSGTDTKGGDGLQSLLHAETVIQADV